MILLCWASVPLYLKYAFRKWCLKARLSPSNNLTPAALVVTQWPLCERWWERTGLTRGWGRRQTGIREGKWYGTRVNGETCKGKTREEKNPKSADKPAEETTGGEGGKCLAWRLGIDFSCLSTSLPFLVRNVLLFMSCRCSQESKHKWLSFFFPLCMQQP